MTERQEAALTSVPERRRLGGSAVAVTKLGLGCAPLAGLYAHVPAAEATAVVEAALAHGVGYLDTAPLYGHGVSERRLRTALRGVPRDAYVLSTKVGRVISPRAGAGTGRFADGAPAEVSFDYSADGVRRSLESSLERLGLDRIDIAYIHDPDQHEAEALATAYPALAALRDQGALGAIGVGMNQTRIPARFVRETDLDVVLLAGRWTLLDQSGAEDLLPACHERGVSVVVGGVFNSGILAHPRAGATYDYAPASRALVRKARRIAEVCAARGVPLKAAALRFPLSHPAVASVLVGARSVTEVDECAAMFDTETPVQLWNDLVDAGVLPQRFVP